MTRLHFRTPRLHVVFGRADLGLKHSNEARF